MNDPWDVKSVRQSGQYMSCMKINGVPLLPPILSKECRKEMQYYKLLAKEVEKRIHVLKSFAVESDTESNTDKTYAPDLPESEQSFEMLIEDTKLDLDDDVNKNAPTTPEKNVIDPMENTMFNNTNSTFDNIASNFTTDTDSTLSKLSSKIVLDLSLSLNESSRRQCNTNSQINDLPERDCNCSNNRQKKKLPNMNSSLQNEIVGDNLNVKLTINNKCLTEPTPNVSQDGPPSLGSKSFTGSLNNLHLEGLKPPPLLRQRSYTVLQPSPLLLAHLEVQSLNTGVDVKSISMSESLSNINSLNRKRRSWDLETAKVKWSSMALELKEKDIAKNLRKTNHVKTNINGTQKKSIHSTPSKAKSFTQEKLKRYPTKIFNKSDPIIRPQKSGSPVRNPLIKQTPECNIVKSTEHKDENPKPTPTSESEDPATRVRELYEKIQKQQLVQMANLVEKQKREQMLLQQVFEEQNNLLFTQLKNICPQSPNEIKEAWPESDDTRRGPVSLSQLINQTAPEQIDSPVLNTLTETNNYLNHCDKVLKKSRDISSSLKKQNQKSKNPKDSAQSPKSNVDHSPTRPHSPGLRNSQTSRKLTYETSTSSERDYEPILTDRTNDTFADLNVTFPSDNTEEYQMLNHINVESPNLNGNGAINSLNSSQNSGSYRSTDTAIRSMEKTIQNSINSMYRVRNIKPKINHQPTAQERAAATKIVAYAKGFLVRRLMKTERVRTTVQTIKDALLCALQLHEDREGIRGADVDLHRRLIQQITAACYTLHDTFVANTPAERCAIIAADRARKRMLAARPPFRHYKPTDIMSKSHSGVFPTRPKRASPSLMTQSNYENFSGERTRRYMSSPRRRPWR